MSEGSESGLSMKAILKNISGCQRAAFEGGAVWAEAGHPLARKSRINRKEINLDTIYVLFQGRLSGIL